MFVGEDQHSLDTKGRVILPAKFRDQLADGSVVTKSGSGDGCLVVYTAEEFMRVAHTQLVAVDEVAAGAVELFMRYVRQPLRIPIDMQLADRELWAWAEAEARKQPDFKPVEQWRSEIQRKMASP